MPLSRGKYFTCSRTIRLYAWPSCLVLWPPVAERLKAISTWPWTQGAPLDLSLKMQLISELADRIGRPVDLVDLHSAGEPLLGQILRYGKKILGDNTYYADLIRKHVFDEADFLRYRNEMIAQRRRAWIRT